MAPVQDLYQATRSIMEEPSEIACSLQILVSTQCLVHTGPTFMLNPWLVIYYFALLSHLRTYILNIDTSRLNLYF